MQARTSPFPFGDSGKTGIKDRLGIILGAGALFLILFFLSTKWDTGHCPDEAMHYLIPQFILRHGALPNGFDPEIRDASWGFSYAFMPYLASMISALFMKAASFFTEDAAWLLVAARQVSVFSGVGTFVVCCYIGKEIFRKPATKYVLAVFVTCLPQTLYLFSYLNNDAFAVFCCSLVILGWIRGVRGGWTARSCVLLGIACGLTLMSYYHAYGILVCSVFVFLISCIREKMPFKTIVKRGLLILGIAFLIAGWFFIRNAVLYQGDFLGMRSASEESEMYAIPTLKPSAKISMREQGVSIKEMFFPDETSGFAYGWVRISLRSFFCMLGNLEFMSTALEFRIFMGLIGLGGLFFLLSFPFGRRKNLYYMPWQMSAGLILAVLIPAALSAWHSWTADYQPQGRYLMPGITALMILALLGYENTDCKLFRKQIENKSMLGGPLSFRGIAVLALVTLTAWCCGKYMPLCF